MEKISVFVPVYRESDFLDDIIESLLEDPYKNKEIFVIIDEPTRKSLGLVEKYKGKIKFILNKKRKGKARALNEAVEKSSGKILLFLDSDVKIPRKYKSFLKKVASSIKDCDILEIKKRVIRESLISKLVNYDYISFNFVEWLFSEKFKKCFGVYGPAFGIKREVFYELGMFRRVVAEDLEIGLRAFIENKKLKYDKEIEVWNKAPTSWEHWFRQRERWGIGVALWLKKHFKEIVHSFLKSPKLLFPFLPFILPAFFFLLSSSIIFGYMVKKTFIQSSISNLLSANFTLSYLPTLLIWETILIFVLFFILSIIFFTAAKKLKYEFYIKEFFVYLFFYVPLNTLIYLTSFVKVFILSDYKLKDWKI